MADAPRSDANQYDAATAVAQSRTAKFMVRVVLRLLAVYLTGLRVPQNKLVSLD